MKIELTPQEASLLEIKKILFEAQKDYTVDEVLELLDQIRDAEVFYSQGESNESKRLFSQYAALGDKLFALIPE